MDGFFGDELLRPMGEPVVEELVDKDFQALLWGQSRVNFDDLVVRPVESTGAVAAQLALGDWHGLAHWMRARRRLRSARISR